MFASWSLILGVACAPAPAPVAPPAAPPAPAPAAPSTPAPAAAKPAPKPDAALDPAQRRAYLAALEEGRKAHRAKDFVAAVAQFDAALALQPDDPRALAERGWAQLQAGKLAEAEADTRAALRRSTDRKLLGSAWYNLGRVQEAQDKKADAAASYRLSLELRPNEIVAKRLAELGAPAKDAFTAQVLAGPYASLEAWCAAQKAAAPVDPDASFFACDPTGAKLGEYEGPRSTKGGGFEEVRVLATGSSAFSSELDGTGEVRLSLAFQTAKGWYTLDAFTSIYNPGAFGIFAQMTAEELKVEGDRVIFRYRLDSHDSDMGLNEIQSDSSSWLVVCAQGAAGPSCVAPVLTAEKSERGPLQEGEDPDPTIQHDFFSNSWTGSATLSPEGMLEISGPANDRLPGHVGKHPLVFP